MRRATVIGAAALLLTSVGDGARENPQAADSKSTIEPGRPSISVTASPRLGYVPMDISVHAELKGSRVDYEPFYCATIVWEWGDGTTSENTPDCDPYVAGTSRIRRHHTSRHRYTVTGSFDVRFQMKKGDVVVGSGSHAVLVRPPMPSTVQGPP